jgi:hypothetical protein
MSVMSTLGTALGHLRNRPRTPFLQVLDTLGTGLGGTDITGDYSEEPTDFFIQAPAGRQVYIRRVALSLTMSSTPAHADYGSIAGGLTNGSRFIYRSDMVEDIINESVGPLKNNGDLARFGAAVQTIDFGGVKDIWCFAVDIARCCGSPLILNPSTSDRFTIRVNDDFDGLADHQVLVSGDFQIITL